MTRPKLLVNEVFVLEQVVPYDSSDVLGVFITPRAAMDTRPERWQEVRNGSEHFWTTRKHHDSMAAFYLITTHPLRSK